MLKLRNHIQTDNKADPAAFRRLCVETSCRYKIGKIWHQPPSGGCVLKRSCCLLHVYDDFQPPSGGCVLKPEYVCVYERTKNQPPSGGCVLKHVKSPMFQQVQNQPPSGGCVLKRCCTNRILTFFNQPPSGGCVLKPNTIRDIGMTHKPAAFRRLCVETIDS